MNKQPAVFHRVGTCVILIIYAVPLYWLVSTSFMANEDVGNPSHVLLFHPTAAAYHYAANSGLLPAAEASALISVGTTVLTLALAVPTAYGLAGLAGRAAGLAMFAILILQVTPESSSVIPLYQILAYWHLLGSYLGVILATSANLLPFSLLLLIPFFVSVPGELYQAAMVDGAGAVSRFRRIAVPLARNGVITVGTVVFIGAWGQFLYAICFLTNPQEYPLTAIIAQQTSTYGNNWPGLMAVATLASLPILVIYIFGQRYLVRGIAAGSLR